MGCDPLSVNWTRRRTRGHAGQKRHHADAREGEERHPVPPGDVAQCAGCDRAERGEQVSGMAFFIGYLLAALGPVAAGALRDVTGGYRVPFLALAGVGVMTLLAGMAAGSDRAVGSSSAG